MVVVDAVKRWWYSAGPARPNRRPWQQILRDAPGDWFWARSGGPGDFLGIVVVAAVLVAGLGIGNAIAINWCVSKVPTVLSGFRALRRREFMMWNRPQLYQRPGYMSGPPKPMEVDPNANGVPPIVARIIRSAERGNRGAGLLDDWLNARARIPGIAIELGVLVLGTFVAPIPRILLFPINFVVQQVPTGLSIWLSGMNRDISRFWRSGARQRADTLDRYYTRHPELVPAEGRARRGIDGPTPVVAIRTAAGTSAGVNASTHTVGEATASPTASATRTVPVAAARVVPETGAPAPRLLLPGRSLRRSPTLDPAGMGVGLE